MKTFSGEIMNCFSYPRILTSEVGMKHSVYVPGGKKIFGLNPGEEEVKLKNVLETDYLYEYNGEEFQTISKWLQYATGNIRKLYEKETLVF
ncbi:MAG: hypothetical protein WDA08_08255 [Weeksellaceae bacterium]